jgi:hypothetical protein
LSYRDYLTAFSSDADDAYTVYGTVDWDFNLVGTNDGSGKWIRAMGQPFLKGGEEFDLRALDGPGVPGARLKELKVKRPTFVDATTTPQFPRVSQLTYSA